MGKAHARLRVIEREREREREGERERAQDKSSRTSRVSRWTATTESVTKLCEQSMKRLETFEVYTKIWRKKRRQHAHSYIDIAIHRCYLDCLQGRSFCAIFEPLFLRGCRPIRLVG